jgi:apolipoprotein N-acyltransferase
LRAIEEGLPVYRLANTGVSGGFDSFGRLLGKSKLGVEAVLDLPHIHPAPAPFYVKNRSLLFWLIILWLVGGAIFLEFANQKSNKWQDDL